MNFSSRRESEKKYKTDEIKIPSPRSLSQSTGETTFVFKNSPSDSFFAAELQNVCMETLRFENNIFLSKEN